MKKKLTIIFKAGDEQITCEPFRLFRSEVMHNWYVTLRSNMLARSTMKEDPRKRNRRAYKKIIELIGGIQNLHCPEKITVTFNHFFVFPDGRAMVVYPSLFAMERCAFVRDGTDFDTMAKDHAHWHGGM